MGSEVRVTKMTDLLKSMTAAAESIAMDEGKSATILPYLHIHLFSTTHVTIPEPGAPFLYMMLGIPQDALKDNAIASIPLSGQDPRHGGLTLIQPVIRLVPAQRILKAVQRGFFVDHQHFNAMHLAILAHIVHGQCLAEHRVVCAAAQYPAF